MNIGPGTNDEVVKKFLDLNKIDKNEIYEEMSNLKEGQNKKGKIMSVIKDYVPSKIITSIKKNN